MNKLFFPFLIVIMFLSSVNAQETEDSKIKEVILSNQENELLKDIPDQKGNNKLDKESLYKNQTLINQNGDNNVIFTFVEGSGNINLIQQNGRGNYVEKDIEGDDLILETSQYGNYNYILQRVKGDNTEYRFQQNGVNNELLYSDERSSGMNIKMQGSDMKLKITVK